jgi:PTS system N-acetylglucosamine-specific IIC component
MNDMDEVDEDGLKQNGARGVVKVDKTNLQVIIGTEVEFVADAMRSQHPDSNAE